MTNHTSPSPFEGYDFDDNAQNGADFSTDFFGSDDVFGMLGGPSTTKQGSGDSGMSMGSIGNMSVGSGNGLGGGNGNGSGMSTGMTGSRRDSGDDLFPVMPGMVAMAENDRRMQQDVQDMSATSTASTAASQGLSTGLGGYGFQDQYGHSPGTGTEQAHMLDNSPGMYAPMDQGYGMSPGYVQAQHQQMQQQQYYHQPIHQQQQQQAQQQQQQLRNTRAHELFGGAAPHNASAPLGTGASATFGLSAHTPYPTGVPADHGAWQSTPEPDANMEDMDVWNTSGPGMDPKEFEELVERLSNQGSRAPTPNPANDYSTPVSFPTSLTDGSLQSSHNESPFPTTHIPSPSFSPLPRPGSATSNHSGMMANSTSPFNKPHSPPALIMPNNNNAPSPAPALPPIVTQTAAPTSGSGGQGHALTGQIGGMGGLLPPTNPQLEHLSGMMGISPIAPNADGPQIFVQPSTPISGLKDGRGHFDAVLRKVGLQAQNQAQQHAQQQSRASGSDHQRSRSPSVSAVSVSGESVGQYNVLSPMGASPGSTGPAQGQGQGQMQDMNWDALSAHSGAANIARPRAKSDSHMSLAEADRQAMFSYLAQAQMAGVAPDQAVMDNMAPDQRSQIEGWLSSMTMNSPGMGYAQLQQQQQQQQQQGIGQVEIPTTMDPNQLPGNDNAPSPGLPSASATIATSVPSTARPGYTNAAEELRQKHLQQQRQLELIQAQQRHKLSLNTSLQGASGSSSGILKYEPGEFSPTSLAFYQQQGLFPVGTGQALPGGMGVFAAHPGGLDNNFGQIQGFNPAHISTTASAPYYQTHFASSASSADLPSAGLSSMGGQFPHTAAPGGTFLAPDGASGHTTRRRSFAEGSHHATGAGTPGYGAALQRPMGMYTGTGGGPGTLSPFGTLDPGRLRGVGAQGHKRSARSEDFGRSGWGVGQGGSTTEFLNSITGNDGSLIPPLRGRTNSHSRLSSASSVRSASPALSISSQGSSMSMSHPNYRGAGASRMDMPEGQSVPMPMGHHSHSHSRSGSNASQQGAARLAKMKVTSMATEVAATSRRTNDGVFHCPVPGCGSTFTRHFNLKGHMRSHNDERPFKCLYDGCPKAEIGFARQHDCKRHMLLHKGLRPFECDACGKKFARLDALTRHHRSEQGQECAITHPLPVNPDGSAMSESQYKAYKAHEAQIQGLLHPQGLGVGSDDGNEGTGKKGKARRKSGAGRSHLSASNSASGMSGDEDLGGGVSGMEDYDRA